MQFLDSFKVNPYGLSIVIGGNCSRYNDFNVQQNERLAFRDILALSWTFTLFIYLFPENQDLAGDVVQNLHNYFRAMYKKVVALIYDPDFVPDFLWYSCSCFHLCSFCNIC